MGHVLLHEDRHPAPEEREGRRDLGADVRAADHDDALPALRVRADRVRVPQRPQIVDALEPHALGAQQPDVGPGGEQRLVEGHLLLCGEDGDAIVEVELEHGRAGLELDRLLLPPLVGPEQRVLQALLALEVALRARRAVVGRVRLAAHEQDRAVGTLLPQPAGAVRRGQPAADEQDVDVAVSHRAGCRWARSAR